MASGERTLGARGPARPATSPPPPPSNRTTPPVRRTGIPRYVGGMPFARLATATTPTSHIGLGLAAVGRPGYINLGRDEDLGEDRSVETLRARTHELLDAAYFQ